MKSDYNGGLTREKFLFYEIRIVASLYLQGYSKQDIIQKITADNMFQFPTERMISSIAGTCLRRIEALDSEALVYHLANAQADVAKQITLIILEDVEDYLTDEGIDINKPATSTRKIGFA